MNRGSVIFLPDSFGTSLQHCIPLLRIKFMSLLSSSIVHGPRLSPTFSQQGCLPMILERNRGNKQRMLQINKQIMKKHNFVLIYIETKILPANTKIKKTNKQFFTKTQLMIELRKAKKKREEDQGSCFENYFWHDFASNDWNSATFRLEKWRVGCRWHDCLLQLSIWIKLKWERNKGFYNKAAPFMGGSNSFFVLFFNFSCNYCGFWFCSRGILTLI